MHSNGLLLFAGRVSCALFFARKKKELTEKDVSLSSLALGFSYHKVLFASVQYNTLMIQTASKHLKLEAIFAMAQDTDKHILTARKG